MKFIDPSTYDNLCNDCRALLASITTEIEENGADTDNCEAPIDYMYDHKLLCGGHVCIAGEIARDTREPWRDLDVDQENPVDNDVETWLRIFARNPEMW